MNKLWLGGILVAALLLTFVADDFLDEAIIGPTLYFLWVGRLILASIPQSILWGAFLLMAVVVTWQTSFKKPRRPQRPSFAPAPSPGRIADWIRLVERSEQEVYYKWQLAQRLQRLTLKAIAHNERTSLRIIRRRLLAEKLGLSAEIQAYFLASIASFGNFTTPKFRLFRQAPPPTPLDLEPEKIAQFLEEKFNL